MEIPAVIIEKAKEIFNEHLQNSQSFPEDEWIGIGEDWDLNLWVYDNAPKATLYPVINGNTDPLIYHSII